MANIALRMPIEQKGTDKNVGAVKSSDSKTNECIKGDRGAENKEGQEDSSNNSC